MNSVRRRWAIVAQGALRRVDCLLVLILIALLVHTSDLLPPDYFRRRLSDRTSGLKFDFVAWEVRTWLVKAGMEFVAPQDTLSEEQRHALVSDYLAHVRRAGELRAEIRELYSHFEGDEAARRAAGLEDELRCVREWLREHQEWSEGILEEQVSAILEEEGMGRWGYVWPPVKFRFTDLPLLLVISRRARITREADVHLEPGMPLAEQEALEERIDRSFPQMRSLVTAIGGLSAYPAMVLEYDSLIWLSDTFAHEWTHDFLLFHPLGYNYNSSGEMTTINETTACIVGREVGRKVIQRYYPELSDHLPPLPTPPARPPLSVREVPPPEEPPPGQFDYNREMRKTRLRVDELLAAGKIEEAEAYMEERRQFFVAHGYHIRKLNQAYFAFYGSYATSPSTVSPIGGQMEWLRAQCPSLRAFLLTVARIDRPQELTALVQRGNPCRRR